MSGPKKQVSSVLPTCAMRAAPELQKQSISWAHGEELGSSSPGQDFQGQAAWVSHLNVQWFMVGQCYLPFTFLAFA